MNAEKTGALIREAREAKNLSQQQLAEQLHITRTTVSKWENGRGMPDVSLLERLAEVLELSVTELVCGERTAGEPETALRDVIRISDKNRKRDRRLIAALAAAA
ncbi:MAG: helix-turn-helix transcriptional regulator, partial [Oscillospiraceae bacterium]|nr:helix-turn-helix transcriptional regulator [Oscillospiraceae bacterium]